MTQLRAQRAAEAELEPFLREERQEHEEAELQQEDRAEGLRRAGRACVGLGLVAAGLGLGAGGLGRGWGLV